MMQSRSLDQVGKKKERKKERKKKTNKITHSGEIYGPEKHSTHLIPPLSLSLSLSHLLLATLRNLAK